MGFRTPKLYHIRARCSSAAHYSSERIYTLRKLPIHHAVNIGFPNQPLLLFQRPKN